MHQEAPAELGGLHALGMAHEQRRAQVGLEPAQGLGQRRLRLAGGARRRMQAAVLGDGQEIEHLLQRHEMPSGYRLRDSATGADGPGFVQCRHSKT